MVSIKCFFFQFLFYQSIFVATFADLLIIIISIYLTSYFEEFNEMVVVYKDKVSTISVWFLRYQIHFLTRFCSEYSGWFFGVNSVAMILKYRFPSLRKGIVVSVQHITWYGIFLVLYYFHYTCYIIYHNNSNAVSS